MSRNRMLVLIALLLAAALSAAAGPAMAHPSASAAVPSANAAALPSPEAALPSTEAAPPSVVEPPVALVAAPSETLGLTPWMAAGALALAAATVRRRPRRALVLCLVLLLTLFAFENALHSVHHGLDAKQADACTIAAASAHLSAVAVDALVETSIVLVAAGPAADPDFSTLPARWLGPDQGRAPPTPTA